MEPVESLETATCGVGDFGAAGDDTAEAGDDGTTGSSAAARACTGTGLSGCGAITMEASHHKPSAHPSAPAIRKI